MVPALLWLTAAVALGTYLLDRAVAFERHHGTYVTNGQPQDFRAEFYFECGGQDGADATITVQDADVAAATWGLLEGRISFEQYAKFTDEQDPVFQEPMKRLAAGVLKHCETSP